MARTFVNKRLLITICLGLVGTPTAAYAAMTVIDPSAISKLGEQLNQMRKQIQELQAIKGEIENQIKAIGKATTITIPNFNLDKMRQALSKTVRCTLLDKDDIMAMIPGLKIEDVDFSSVCQSRQIYNKLLFSTNNPKSTSVQKTALNEMIHSRRNAFLADTTTKSLALADQTVHQGETISQSVDELEAAAATAQSMNDRLAVIAKGQALMARSQAQTNQLLSMLLKLQASVHVKSLPAAMTTRKDNTPKQ